MRDRDGKRSASPSLLTPLLSEGHGGELAIG